jgi:hypothetical protein
MAFLSHGLSPAYKNAGAHVRGSGDAANMGLFFLCLAVCVLQKPVFPYYNQCFAIFLQICEIGVLTDWGG